MKPWLRWSLIGVALVAVLWVLQATVFRAPPIEVDTVVATRGLVEDAVTNSQAGTVKARLRTQLGAERTGRVVRIPFREGSSVRRGAILLELDASSAVVGLELARRDRETLEATLAAARAAAQLARSDYDRALKLREQALISQEQMDQSLSRHQAAQADLEAAQARRARAESAVRLAQDEIDHLRVVAPFDGEVTARYVEAGQSVIPGQPLLELTNLEQLYVSAPIDEIDIGRLAEKLPARVTLDPYPGVAWQGTVTRVAAVVSDLKEQNRTLDIEVELQYDPNKPQAKPGTSADVSIVLDRREGVLRVPTFAVADGRRVMIMKDGKAETREIETGIKNWEWTEVKSGLAEGDAVITNLDQQGLAAGVRVARRAAADTAAAGARGKK